MGAVHFSLSSFQNSAQLNLIVVFRTQKSDLCKYKGVMMELEF